MKTPAAILCSLALAAGCRCGAPSEAPLAARVNGRPIPLAAIQARAEKDLQRKAKFGKDPNSPAALAPHLRQRLDEAIREELLAQASESIDATGLEDEVESQLKRLAESPAHGGDRTENADELRQRVRRNVRIGRYLAAKGLNDPPVDEAEIRKIYESMKGSLRNPESIHVKHVLLKPADATPAAKSAAAAEASRILADIRAGKITLEDAARKHSACNSAESGGDLGEVALGYLPAPVERAALALEPGAIGGPVESKFGYHVVQFIERKPAYTPDYAAAHDFVAKYLKERASTELLAAHVEQLRAGAKVEVLLQ